MTKNNQMNKKKIAIVTWRGTYNYGTSLQSFALQYKLKKMGYDVYYLKHIPKNLSLITLFKQKIKQFSQLFVDEEHNKTVKQKKSIRFHKLFSKTIEIASNSHYNKLLHDIDVFISGSDQIWNTHYRYDPFFFLDFAKGKKKISYASSIGAQNVKAEYSERVRKHLLEYSHIGVREQSAVDVLRKLTGRKDITPVLDPTLLLDHSDWNDVIEKANIEIELPAKYILCYFIGKNEHYRTQLEDIKTILGINDVVIIPATENKDFKIEGSLLYLDAGPMEFVKLIHNATYICTDSFHATALSINFNKPFVEFLRFSEISEHSQNSRIFDILSMFKLENRIYELSDGKWNTPFNYTNTNQILENQRQRSTEFLIESIEN